MARCITTLFICVIFTNSCNLKIQKHDQEVHQTWFRKIQVQTLEPRCVKCHSGATAKNGVQVDSYENLMGSRMKNGSLVIDPKDDD